MKAAIETAIGVAKEVPDKWFDCLLALLWPIATLEGHHDSMHSPLTMKLSLSISGFGLKVERLPSAVEEWIQMTPG